MSPKPSERRLHDRLALKGTVTARSGTELWQGRLRDLGRGGAYVSTSDTGSAHVGDGVLVELRLDAGLAEWLPISARVSRVEAEGLALTFDEALPGLESLMSHMGHASRANARVYSIVLVDPDPERGEQRAFAFRAAGCEVIYASTQLEAIVRLGEASFEPDVIVVADTLSKAADDLRAFVERDHPSVHLVAIADGDDDAVKHVFARIDVG